MRKSFPRLFARKSRLLIVCVILTGLVGFGVSVSSHSGENAPSRAVSPEKAPQVQRTGVMGSFLNLLMPLPSISATKVDSFPTTGAGGYDVDADGKADVGDKIRYTVTINNGGPSQADNLTLQDTVDTNTTYIPGSLNVSPLAKDDSYDTVGNTLLEVGVAASGNPSVRVTDPTKDSAFDNDTEFLGDTIIFDTITQNPTNGTLTFNTNGTFSYQPNANFIGTDTFKYRIKDAGGLTDIATVTINVNASNPTVSATSKVWYVKNNNSGPGTAGTSSDPFKTLLQAQTASGTGDTIYIDHGDGTTTGQNTGITLKASQRLIGEAVQLDVPIAVNGGANPTVLKAAGTRPLIDNIAGDCVTVSNISIAQIRGLNLAGTLNAVDMTTTAANSGGGEIADNIVRSAGQEGFDVNGGGTGTMTVSIHDNTVTSTGDGINIFRTAGSVVVTAFDDNTVTGATGGNGISVLGSGGTVLFDANPSTAAFDTVSGGNTVIGQSGNGVALSGISLTNIRGDISFNDLDIFADNGTALSVLGTTPNYTGTSGTRVTASTNTPTLVSVNGAAADITDANVNLVPTTMTSTNSTGSGVSLVRVSGTFTAPSGSSITNATSADFLINGGSSTAANVNVTYPGTITDDVGALVSVTNVTPTVASTIIFSGAITDNNDGDGGELGVSLTGNTNATITFSGGLLIRTTTNPAFTATGGGTVNVCDENPCNPAATGALVNQLTTTTGTALNVANTNIGSNGLEFRSITAGTAASGPANGIILNTTGSAGGLSVKGTGSAGSGGTIQKATGDAISLTSTEKVSLNRMIIQNGLGSGIAGSTVNGFVLDSSTITANGNGANDNGIKMANLTGTASGGLRPTSITNNTISNNFWFEIEVSNSTGTLTDLQMSGNALSSNGLQLNHGNLFNFLATGTNSMTLNVTSGSFTGNVDTAGGTKITTGTGLQCDHSGTGGTLTCNVSNATFTTNNVGPQASVAGNGNVVFDFFNNNIQGSRSHAINFFADANAPFTKTLQGKARNNIIGTAGVSASGSEVGFPIRIQNEGRVPVTIEVLNNTINESLSFTGINVNHGISTTAGTSATNVTITGNSVNNVDSGRAILVQQVDHTTAGLNAGTVCADISGNSFSNIAGQAGDGTVIRIREQSNNSGGPFNVRQLAPTTAVNVAELDDANGVNDNPTGSKISVSGSPNYNAGACTLPVNAMLNTPNSNGQYFAQNNEFQNDNTLFDFVKSNATAYASVSDAMNHAAKPGSLNNTALSSMEESESASQPTASTSAVIKPEIEKGAFALAHGNSPTLASRLSNFISAITERVAPTAQAAPAPLPVLDINQNLGTLPTGKSLTITFDVSVNGPYPVATYTNQGTVKADGVADKLTDDPAVGGGSDPTVTPGDRYDTTTAITVVPTSPSNFGDSVAFTAIVTPTEGSGVTPNGTVQFKDGASNLGAAVNCLPNAGNTCKADLPAFTTLPAGSHSITAVYSGGTNHDPSTGGPITYVVNACVPNPTVTNTGDNGGVNPAEGAGTGTLRQAIIDVCPGTTINATGISGQITLLAALPNITKNMTINGPGANQLEVRGSQVLGNSYRVFNVTAAATNVTINGLTMSNGSDALGGGGVNNAGVLNLTSCTVSGNTTTGSGGGIQNTGTLTIDKCTVSNNTASVNGGGISNTGALSITNSTISTNTANVVGVSLGGGIYNSSGVNTVTLQSSTVASNTSDASGGGIYNAGGTINFGNTIVGDNIATASPDLAGAGVFNSQDYNLFESTTVVFTGTTTHDKTGVDPKLGALTNNGGPTFTHALLDGSPAVDAGNTTLTVDQRGQPREIDNPNVTDAVGGDKSDIGAYEAPAPPNAPDLDTASDTPPGGNQTDNITSDNSPTFTITGVQSGDTVSLERNGVFVVSGLAAGTSIQLTDPGPVADGTYTYTARRQVSGGPSNASLGLSVTIDTAAPTLNISAPSQASANAAGSVDYTVTYSGADAVTLANGNITLNSTGTASATVNVTGSGTATRTVTLSGFTGTGTLGISIGAGTASDVAGNLAAAAGPSATFTVDADAPTVSMASVTSNPTNVSPIPVTVTFNEPVFGFTSTDITPGNGTVGNFSGADGSSVYTFDLTPSGQGTVTADIGAGVATDAAGNGNTAATQFSRTFDTVAPTVNITAVTPDPRNTSVGSITIVFSEAVTGFDLADLSLTRDGGGNLLTGAQTLTTLDNITWTLGNLSGLTGTQGSYTLTLTAPGGITDTAGNALATGASDTWVVDTTAPTVTIDPPSQTIANASSTVTYLVTYTDANFNASTLAPGNITLNTTGTASATVGVSGSGNTRTVTLNGLTGNGTIGISIAAGTASDTAGNNAGAAGPSATFTVDTTPPGVSMASAASNPTNTSPIPVTVTFTESTTDFDATDITPGNGTISNFAGSGTSYTFDLTPSGQGTVTADIGAGVATDAAGNGNTAATQFSRTFDDVKPTVNISAPSQALANGSDVVTYTVTYTDTNFNASTLSTGDITLNTTGTASATVGVSCAANICTVTLNTLTGDGTIGISIKAGTASDTGGNSADAAGPSATFTVDTTQPTVTINQAAGQSDPSGGTAVNFTVIFSEPITGFTSTDVNFSGAGATTATVTEIAPNDRTHFNVAISGMNTFGLVTASINAGAVQDDAANLSTASTSTDNTVNYILDAATAYEVNSTANTDDGSCDPLGAGTNCTLREAINAANLDAGSETITFAPALTSGGPATITLDGLGALPDINGDLVITGPTDNRLTISGNNTSRVFLITPTQTVSMSNLTIANGRDGYGGGIYSEGNLTITNSTLTNNHALLSLPGGSGEGGAIDSEGGTLTIINSTISGNSAETFGGGLLNCGNSTAILTNVTITGNRADVDSGPPTAGGGGIGQVSSVANSVTLVNTIVAGNFKGSAGSIADDILVDPASSLDLAGSKNNLIGDSGTAGGITNGGANNNKVGNAGLGTVNISTVLDTTLASNGGPTQTHLLVPGSPARDSGNGCVTLPTGSGGCLATPLTTDQRGTGFPRFVGTHVDMGAVEVSYSIAPIAGAPLSAVIGTAFTVPTRVVVKESGILKSGVAVTYTAPNSGPSGTFPGNVLIVTVLTDVFGEATAPTLTANNIVGGPYTLTATLTGSSQTTDIGQLTNTKMPATVNLSNLVQTFTGGQTFATVTTTPAGIPVDVTYDGSATAPVNVGSYQVVATINHANYQGSSTATLQINKANQTITFNPNPLPDRTFGDADFGISASTTAVTGGPVTFSATGQCIVSNNGGGNGTVHLTGAGSCTITASRAADTNYNAAADVNRPFTINKSGQTITFGALAAKTFGNPDFTVSATTTAAGLNVSFGATGQCTITNTGTGTETVHLTGGGSCTITASQAGNSNYNAAAPVPQSFNIATAASTTALASSVNPSSVGQNVTFTATVTSAVSGTITGTVQFKDGVTNLGAPVALNASGVATFSTTTLTAGNHAITAVYSGDANFSTSTGTLSGGQQVNIQTTISINDVQVTEGNAGTTNLVFTVTLSQASNQTVKVDFATADGTATVAGNDYVANNGTLTFIPGDLTKDITVQVKGDTANEPNETLFVNLSNPQNTTISDNQGLGTILNDDAPGVQFSSNSYNVNEGVVTGFAPITVNRTGDISTPLTVDYITSDQSALTPCQTNNTGFASDRCDYETAAGTLSFAAGEASKTIQVVIINDAYVEGPEALTIKLSNPSGGALGATDTATLTINDNDTQVATTNPIDNLDFFIFMQYADFLGRVPDAAGFQFWKDRMTTQCPAGQTCDRIDTALRFFASDEFRERGYFVYLFYHAALGRRPTYAEWIMDVSKLNGPKTIAEQNAARDAFINEFMSRQEFMNLYNGAQTGQTFVDALIQKSGVTPASRQTLINNYGTVGRANTLRAFIETTEVQAAYLDRGFVTMLYFGFLRRDAEAGGFAFWMQKLNDSNHDYRLLVGGFINSDEYYYRYAQIQHTP